MRLFFLLPLQPQIRCSDSQHSTHRSHSHTGEPHKSTSTPDLQSKRHSTPLMPVRDTPSPPPGYIPESDHQVIKRGDHHGEGHFIPEPDDGQMSRSEVSGQAVIVAGPSLCPIFSTMLCLKLNTYCSLQCYMTR